MGAKLCVFREVIWWVSCFLRDIDVEVVETVSV